MGMCSENWRDCLQLLRIADKDLCREWLNMFARVWSDSLEKFDWMLEALAESIFTLQMTFGRDSPSVLGGGGTLALICSILEWMHMTEEGRGVMASPRGWRAIEVLLSYLRGFGTMSVDMHEKISSAAKVWDDNLRRLGLVAEDVLDEEESLLAEARRVERGRENVWREVWQKLSRKGPETPEQRKARAADLRELAKELSSKYKVHKEYVSSHQRILRRIEYALEHAIVSATPGQQAALDDAMWDNRLKACIALLEGTAAIAAPALVLAGTIAATPFTFGALAIAVAPEVLALLGGAFACARFYTDAYGHLKEASVHAHHLNRVRACGGSAPAAQPLNHPAEDLFVQEQGCFPFVEAILAVINSPETDESLREDYIMLLAGFLNLVLVAWAGGKMLNAESAAVWSVVSELYNALDGRESEVATEGRKRLVTLRDALLDMKLPTPAGTINCSPLWDAPSPTVLPARRATADIPWGQWFVEDSEVAAMMIELSPSGTRCEWAKLDAMTIRNAKSHYVAASSWYASATLLLTEEEKSDWPQFTVWRLSSWGVLHIKHMEDEFPQLRNAPCTSPAGRLVLVRVDCHTTRTDYTEEEIREAYDGTRAPFPNVVHAIPKEPAEPSNLSIAMRTVHGVEVTEGTWRAWMECIEIAFSSAVLGLKCESTDTLVVCGVAPLPLWIYAGKCARSKAGNISFINFFESKWVRWNVPEETEGCIPKPSKYLVDDGTWEVLLLRFTDQPIDDWLVGHKKSLRDAIGVELCKRNCRVNRIECGSVSVNPDILRAVHTQLLHVVEHCLFSDTDIAYAGLVIVPAAPAPICFLTGYVLANAGIRRIRIPNFYRKKARYGKGIHIDEGHLEVTIDNQSAWNW
eukprot:TRINITY_DN269_c0_g1_i1.p1 TRINITY_DN269_c0_g1~~TRINITY_DN269_c0_g1_i1.p1  ORF type:complete len:961 (+),score=113.26 TRINITY_DN269_c0_g1_i1:290-2884(+)